MTLSLMTAEVGLSAVFINNKIWSEKFWENKKKRKKEEKKRKKEKKKGKREKKEEKKRRKKDLPGKSKRI